MCESSLLINEKDDMALREFPRGKGEKEKLKLPGENVTLENKNVIFMGKTIYYPTKSNNLLN